MEAADDFEMPESELPTADPPDAFDIYELVIIRRPETVPELSDDQIELLQRQHLGHLEAMRKAGHLKVAGPLMNQPDQSWRGISIYQVGSLDEAQRLAEADPAVKAGCFRIDVMHWYTRSRALAFPLLS